MMNRLVDKYGRVLHRFFIQRSRSKWDAEELTQEVFCKIIKREDIALSEYTDPYIFTIAWSVLRDRARRERVRHGSMHVTYDEELAQEALIAQENPFSPEAALHGDQLYTRFLEALDDLTPKTREVFILNRYEGLSYSKIAIHCGVSVSTVEKHMIKALQRMKQIV